MEDTVSDTSTLRNSVEDQRRHEFLHQIHSTTTPNQRRHDFLNQNYSRYPSEALIDVITQTRNTNNKRDYGIICMYLTFIIIGVLCLYFGIACFIPLQPFKNPNILGLGVPLIIFGLFFIILCICLRFVCMPPPY